MKPKLFDYANRQSMVDMIRPPSGFRLASAIGTTFSADFVALTSIMLAFVDADGEDGDFSSVPKQLFAVTRLSERMQLFLNRSNLHLNGISPANRIFAIYDRMITEVQFNVGSFHPKVWILKYSTKKTVSNVGSDDRYRVLCSSRNVTIGNNWELAIQLDGEKGRLQPSHSIGAALADYLRRLQPIAKNSSLLTEAIESLPYVAFRLPDGVNQASFVHQWPGKKHLTTQLPSAGKKAVVMAPFLSTGFLDDLCKRFPDVTLISTRRELDLRLNEQLLERMEAIYCVRNDRVDAVSEQLSLHAKLYLFEDQEQSKMMLGSANASHSAWNGVNCEAMVTLEPSITIRQFSEQFIFKNAAKKELNPWIEEYTLEDWLSRDEESEEERVDQQLDNAQAILGRFQFSLDFQESCTQLTLSACSPELRTEIGDCLAQGIDITAFPISMMESDSVSSKENWSIVHSYQAGIAYNATVGKLTEFVCFRIQHKASGLARTIVLKAFKHNFAQFFDVRDKELLRSELSASQFAKFLAAILFEGGSKPQQGLEAMLSKGSSRTGRNSNAIAAGLCIEDIMQSCTEDTTRIGEVTKILELFDGSDAEGNPYAGVDFRAFWTNFKFAFDSMART